MKHIRYYLFLFLAASILNGCGLYTRYSRHGFEAIVELSVCATADR